MVSTECTDAVTLGSQLPWIVQREEFFHMLEIDQYPTPVLSLCPEHPLKAGGAGGCAGTVEWGGALSINLNFILSFHSIR